MENDKSGNCAAADVTSLSRKIQRGLGAIKECSCGKSLAVEGAEEMLKHARATLDKLVTVEKSQESDNLLEVSRVVDRAQKLLSRSGISV